MALITPPTLYDSKRWRGLRIGLLGGSFNPPHQGHAHISKIALRSLCLDFIWWLVTPQNPLKNAQSLMRPSERIALCEKFVDHPNIIISNLEFSLGTNRTFNTVRALKAAYPATDFVWLTGLDNALTFHKWYRWTEILHLVPTAHIARPPYVNVVKKCPLRLKSDQTHVYLDRPARVPLLPRRTYWLLQHKMLAYSSTDIRKGLYKE